MEHILGEKVVGAPQTTIQVRSVELTYLDGTSERLDTTGLQGINGLGFYVFGRLLGQPPFLVNHTQLRRFVESAQAIQ